MNIIHYFTTREIAFNNSNYKSVFNLIPSEERDIFFLTFKNTSKLKLMTAFQRGLKKFVLKEKEEDLEKFKAKYWR